jgi:hypothetical protein
VGQVEQAEVMAVANDGIIYGQAFRERASGLTTYEYRLMGGLINTWLDTHGN